MEIKDKFNELVKLYTEQQSVEEQVKELKEELKEAGHNAAIIASVAKAYAANKTDALQEKSQEVLDIINVVRS